MAFQSVRIEIVGVPIARQRPRFSRFGTYDKQKDIKEMYALSVRSQLPRGFQVIQVPIYLKILYEMPIPKTTSKKKRSLMVGSPHTKKPDIDNLYKMFDSFNGILWLDDSQIYQVSMKKVYSENPKTVLIVEYEGDDI